MTARAADGRDARPGPSNSPGRRVVRSADLFQTARELIIVHGEEEYRLRITRADKLILTK